MKNKDYWIICKRNFSALGVLNAMAVFLFLFSGITMIVIVFLLITLFFAVFAYMFGKRSPVAIPVTYTLLGIAVLSMAIYNVLNPTTFDIASILFYLISGYLLLCVYKAQKQSQSQITGV